MKDNQQSNWVGIVVIGLIIWIGSLWLHAPINRELRRAEQLDKEQLEAEDRAFANRISRITGRPASEYLRRSNND